MCVTMPRATAVRGEIGRDVPVKQSQRETAQIVERLCARRRDGARTGVRGGEGYEEAYCGVSAAFGQTAHSTADTKMLENRSTSQSEKAAPR